MIWVGYAALTLLCVGALIWPLFRRTRTAVPDLEVDQAVYQAQLDEVDRDLTLGLLTEDQADTARTDIRRRMLAAAQRQTEKTSGEAPLLRMGTVTGVALVVPFTALAVYLTIGSPELPGVPVEERRAEALNEAIEHPDQADMNVLIEQLADRLREDPDNAEGWVLLGRSYRQMNRNGEAAAAYRRALAIGIQDPNVFAEFGEVLMTSNSGTLTPEAENAFWAVLDLDREDPRARFYIGLAAAQAGQVEDAIAIWRDLTASAPAGAPWLEMVQQQMGDVAMAAGVMPMMVTPRHPLDAAPAEAQDEPSPPSVATGADTVDDESVVPEADEDDYRPDVSALAGRFSRDQLEMIQEMVGGLEARMEFSEETYDGWMQLARSYGVLGDTEKAANAYRRAIALEPDTIMARVQLADLLLREIGSADAITGEIVDLSTEILALDDSNPDGLFISGLAAASAGNTVLARERWTRLLDILPPGDTARDAVARRLAELPG